MFNLDGKKALITGSSQGIGKAIAICLASFGANVIIHGSNNFEKCQKVIDEIKKSGNSATGSIADLSLIGCAEKLYAQTGDVDILILNASAQISRPWREFSADEIETQMRVNIQSALELIRIYEPYMTRKRWGRIIAVGSVQQYKPHKDMLVYSSTKAAQFNMVQNLAKQLAPNGITVNGLAPGVIATLRNEKALSDTEYKKIIMAGIPCGYIGTVEDCTGAALLLCSEAGRYITGTDLVVDGGMGL